MSTLSQNDTVPTNKHYTVGPDGKLLFNLDFVEEPLGLPAEYGYGWPQFEFGETIGPDSRYAIARKLGWGMTSSTWLARDLLENKYVAIKALTGYYTGLIHRGRIWELEALKRVAAPSQASHCLRLLSNFTVPGKGSAGEHACFVTHLLGGDVKSLQRSYNKAFPLPLAKRILLHTLRGIAQAHRNGVVHTDLKHDNIFFDTGMSAEAVERLLASDPPRRHPVEASYDGVVQAAVSQPLPFPTITEALDRTYVVADFGSAQSITDHIFDQITARALRAPEIYLGGPWNEKVDIWTFGCLIFEFAVGRELYKYEPGRELKLDEIENMLYQMSLFTGEGFEPEQLQASSLASGYFDHTCNLAKHPRRYSYPFEKCIRNYEVMPEEDVLSTAALMRRCLRLDPEARPSAEELLEDPWFSDAASQNTG